MKYSYRYPKLNLSEYTTIRRYGKGSLNEVVREIYPNGSHLAQIVKIERIALDDIDTLVLLNDTHTRNRENAYSLIQSFYKKPINFKKERFFLYHLKVIQTLKRD